MQFVHPQKNAAPKIFYGYVIVIASLIILVIIHGISSSYGIFLGQIQKETYWSRATISGASSLSFFLMGLFSIMSGRMVDKYGPRVVMTFSAVILGIGFFLVSQVNNVWQLYLAYGLVVGIGLSSSDVTMLSTTARWFVKRRGLMTSIVKSGTGLGMFTIPLLSSWLILTTNWRIAYIVLAIVVVVVVILTAIFLKRDPSQIGQQPYGSNTDKQKNQNTDNRDFSSAEVFRRREFWLVCGIYFIIWYVTQSVMVHLAVHLQDEQLTVAQAAMVMSIIGGVSILGRLTMGVTGDRLGNRHALIICCSVLLLSIIWLQFIQGFWKSSLFAVIYGFAHGGFFAIVSPLIAELFGLASHGSNLGLIFFIGQTGGAIGPIITGSIYDKNQSYQLAFYILLGAVIVGLLLAFLLSLYGQGKNKIKIQS
jgi:MFS family permease